MSNPNDANIIVNGQKVVATVAQSGTVVQDGGEIDATCIVEDSNGKRHKAVKIVNIDDEPTDKSEIDAQILNNNNELITVTEEQEGEVIPQDNSEIDFHCLVQKDDGKQLAVKTVELSGNIIKSGGAIDATCVVNAEGKNQLAVKVFKRGGGEIIETVYGTNSITFNAKANGLKALTLFGGTEQSGTPTPDTPVDIVSNNGAIKLSPNEFNPNDVELGYYLYGGNKIASPYNFLTALMPVKPNTSYVLYGKRKSDNRISSYNRLYWYDINKNYIKTDKYSYGQITVVTSPNNAYYAQGGINESGGTSIPTTQEIVDSYNWVFQEGNAEVPYIPYGTTYTDGTVETVTDSLSNTATAEMLLKVGDYQDTQEVLSGHISRKVGIKVLDGTESWVANTVSSGRLVFYVTKASIGSNSTVLPNGSPNIKCSHFETSTAAAQSLYGTVWAGGTAINFTAGDFCANLAAWKQWLADQYAAGTPVIMVYPLATATTETVAGQILNTKEGTNSLTITQASLEGLTLEARYKRER